MLLLSGCQDKHDPLFDQLESRVSDNPDSVRTVLENIDASELQDDFDRSRHALLLMMAQAKCRVSLQSDSAIYMAVEYFHRTKDVLNEAKARYYAGLAERQAGNYQAAIWAALHAIDRAHEAADTFWMGRAHDLASEIYINTYDCRNAAIEADKAAVYFNRAGATLFHRYALLKKAQALNYPVYEDGSPTGRGIHLLDSLKNVALIANDSSLVANCLYHKSIYSFDAKNYKATEAQIDSICEFSPNSVLLEHLLPNIISIKIANGEVSTKLLLEYGERLKTSGDTISYLRIKSKSDSMNKDWESAFHLLDSLRNYYEIIMAEKTFNSVDEIKVKYNKTIIEEKQKENSHLKFTHIITLWLSIGGGILLLVLLMLIRIRNKYKEKVTMGKLFEIASENQDLKTQVEFQEGILTENNVLKEKLKYKLREEKKILNENKDLKEKLQEHVNSQRHILTQNEDLKIKVNDYDLIVNENLLLKEQLHLLESDFEQKLKNKEENVTVDAIQLSQKQTNILGNRIDTLCTLAMDYYSDRDNKALKNEVFHRVLEELRELKSEKFLKALELRINDVHDNILKRFQIQLPEIAKGNLRWIALSVAGVQPRTISFLLNMNIQTLYSKRLRVRSYIEKSNAPDKKEFLLFFPKGKA